MIRRYVVLTDEQADALALWVLHTYVINAADSTPYMQITSAEKRSGKSRLLEVLELVVARPLPVVNISKAALFRSIKDEQPTLLLDEYDALFGPLTDARTKISGRCSTPATAGQRPSSAARQRRWTPQTVASFLCEGTRWYRTSPRHGRGSFDPYRPQAQAGERRGRAVSSAVTSIRSPRPFSGASPSGVAEAVGGDG